MCALTTKPQNQSFFFSLEPGIFFVEQLHWKKEESATFLPQGMLKSLVLRTLPRNWNIVFEHLLAQVGPESIFHIIYMSLLKSGVQNKPGLTISSQISEVVNLVGTCYVRMVRLQFFSSTSLCSCNN